MSLSPHLICPLDSSPLQQQDKSLCCEQGHRFDLARQGYANLLPVQNKRSLAPGDSKEMINARQQFLDAGYYQSIAEEMIAQLKPLLAEESCVIDAGCGEGYYLHQLAQALGAGNDFIGNDISKAAVVKCCQRSRDYSWLVASNRSLPVQADCVDVVLCMFGFPVYDEFLRVLKPGGILLMVDAGPHHLLELREIVYPEIKEKPDNLVLQAQQAGFILQQESALNFQITALPRDAIHSLLLMTPHFFRANAEARNKALALQNINLSVDVNFRLFRNPAGM